MGGPNLPLKTLCGFKVCSRLLFLPRGLTFFHERSGLDRCWAAKYNRTPANRDPQIGQVKGHPNLSSRGLESRVRPWLYLPKNPGDPALMSRKDAALGALGKVKCPEACGPDGTSLSRCAVSTEHLGPSVIPLLEEVKGG